MKQPGDSAVHRALSIINWFNGERPTATAAELSEGLQIPIATVYRIVGDLKDWRLIEQEPNTKFYRLGPRVLDFAYHYRQSTNLSAIAQPYLEELRETTGETASLTIILDDGRICVAEARSKHALNWANPVGSKGPLYAGAAGKAILAFLHPDRLRALSESVELKQFTPDTPKSWEELLEELPKVCELGYSTSWGEVTAGAAGLAVPVLGTDGYSIGSINVSAPFVRWSDEIMQEYIPLIKKAASAISKGFFDV